MINFAPVDTSGEVGGVEAEMIFSLDFWPWKGFGCGFTIMLCEDLEIEDYHRYSCFEWQVKMGRYDFGNGDRAEMRQGLA
jgi:hypothetical protein